MQITMEKDGLRVEADSYGAELKSIRYDGREYLWQGDARWWQGRAPVLFPIVGALRDCQTEIGGERYGMPRHGFAHSSEFQMISQSENELCFMLQDSEETRRQYPFSFCLSVTYRILANALITEFCVKNPGEASLPYCVGGHPAFLVPLDPSEQFEDYFLQFEKNETADCPYVFVETGEIDFSRRRRILTDGAVLPLAHSLFEQDALIFDALHSEKVKMKSEKSGHGVEMDFSGFPILAVWSGFNHAPFVALEPWRGCGDATDEEGRFLKKRHIRSLEPGGMCTESFAVRFF